MQNWSNKSLLLRLQKSNSNGHRADALFVITIIFSHREKMEANQIAAKLICFGVDGVSSFQECRNGVSIQFLDNWTLLYSKSIVMDTSLIWLLKP